MLECCECLRQRFVMISRREDIPSEVILFISGGEFIGAGITWQVFQFNITARI